MTTTMVVSSNLNGTLVRQHTMSDMIRIYREEEDYRWAQTVFSRHAYGLATMEEAFTTAGILSCGITLRQAIDYTIKHMLYMTGFNLFLAALSERHMRLVINSNGYSVITHAIRAHAGKDKVHGFIGNSLEFGRGGSIQEALREDELEMLVSDYFSDPNMCSHDVYDAVKATGRVHLGIVDEKEKARLLKEYVQKHFVDVTPAEIMHLGSTFADLSGILDIARSEGKGVAFNYTIDLENNLQAEIARNPALASNIHFVDKKGRRANLIHVIPLFDK